MKLAFDKGICTLYDIMQEYLFNFSKPKNVEISRTISDIISRLKAIYGSRGYRVL